MVARFEFDEGCVLNGVNLGDVKSVAVSQHTATDEDGEEQMGFTAVIDGAGFDASETLPLFLTGLHMHRDGNRDEKTAFTRVYDSIVNLDSRFEKPEEIGFDHVVMMAGLAFHGPSYLMKHLFGGSEE